MVFGLITCSELKLPSARMGMVTEQQPVVGFMPYSRPKHCPTSVIIDCDVHLYNAGNSRRRPGPVHFELDYSTRSDERDWMPMLLLPAGRQTRSMDTLPRNTVGLPGYMLDMDVVTGTEDLSHRQLDTPVTGSTPTGRLMGTTTGFTQFSPTGPDGVYTFAANTTYTGSIKLTRVNATDMQITSTFGSVVTLEYRCIRLGECRHVGFLGEFEHIRIAASSGEANNGIDFSNVQIEFIPVPEPATI